MHPNFGSLPFSFMYLIVKGSSWCRRVSNHIIKRILSKFISRYPSNALHCHSCQKRFREPFSPAPDISLSFLSIPGYEGSDVLSASSRFRSSTTDLRGSNPPSYPNHVYCLQCGPRSNRTKSWNPYNATLSTAAARQPNLTKTRAPTYVPIPWPMKT